MNIIKYSFPFLLILFIESALSAQDKTEFEKWKEKELQNKQQYKKEYYEGLNTKKALYDQYIKDEQEMLKVYESIGEIPETIANEIDEVENQFPKEEEKISIAELHVELDELTEIKESSSEEPIDITEVVTNAYDDEKTEVVDQPLETTNQTELVAEFKANRPVLSPLPENSYRISSKFNKKRLHPILKTIRPHNGIDMAAPNGTKVYVSANGKVLVSKYSKTAGHMIVVDHKNGYTTTYMHLLKRNVGVGETVSRAEIIGEVGSTGLSSGPHLHYEIRKKGAPYNPLNFIIAHL